MIVLIWILSVLTLPIHCKHTESAKKSEVDKEKTGQESKRQLQLKLFGQSGDSDEDPEKLLERVKQVSPERLNAILANYASEPSRKAPTTVTGETRKLDENGKSTNLMDELSRLNDENEEAASLKELQTGKDELLSLRRKASQADSSSLSPEPGTYDPSAIRQMLAGKLGRVQDTDLPTVEPSPRLALDNVELTDDPKIRLSTKHLHTLDSLQAQDMKSKLLAELASKSTTSPLHSAVTDADGDKLTDISQDIDLKNDDQERKLQLKGIDYNPDSLSPLSKFLRHHHVKHTPDNSDTTDVAAYLALRNRHRIHRLLGSQGPNLIATQGVPLHSGAKITPLSNDISDENLQSLNDNAPARALQSLGKNQRFREASERLKSLNRMQERLSVGAGTGSRETTDLFNAEKAGNRDLTVQPSNVTTEGAVTKSRKSGFSFSYDRDSPLGPDMWSVLHSEWTCKGIKQSPIDIQTDQICKDGLCEAEFVRNVMIKVYPQDKPVVGTLRNNGHAPTLSISDEVSVKFFGANLLNVYYLKQLHFHFGCDNKQGSEHRIDGQTYPLELHLVFWDNKTFPTFAQAAKSDRGIVVVAILFQRSFVPASQVRNTPLAQFLQVVKKIEEEDDQVRITEIFDLRLERMIPNAMNVEQADRFFVYEGSLSTPGCYESVTWVIYDTHPIVTDDQLEVFRRLKSSKVQDASGGNRMCDNFRPLQKLNGRRIYSNIV